MKDGEEFEAEGHNTNATYLSIWLSLKVAVIRM